MLLMVPPWLIKADLLLLDYTHTHICVPMSFPFCYTLMDIFFASFPICFSLLLFLLMVVKLLNKSKPASLKLPPGPWKLPIIGNIHQMIGGLGHHTLRNLSNKHGPLMHLQLGEVSTVVISSPEMAMEVLKKHDRIFASRPRHMLAPDVMSYDHTNIAFAPHGAYWRQLRKICNSELLGVGRVLSFRHVREEEVSNFIKSISLSAGKPVHLTEKIFSLSSAITARAAFGKKSEEQELFLSVVTKFLRLGSGLTVSDFFPSIGWLPLITGMKQKLEHLHREADEILENIINEHKRIKKSTRTSSGEAVEYLIDVLLKYVGGANLEFTLTTDNVKGVLLLDIFTAGSESSSSTVEWAMAEMIKKPSVMKKVQAEVRQVCDRKGKVDETDFHELKYLKLVIKEILRLHPAAPLLIPRECGQTCEINGYQIPQKTRVIVNAWAIGRDPNYWKDPDTFNPERFEDSSTNFMGTSFEFIPFGAGRRICPGILFGLANIELQLAELLYHFDWKLPDGMKPDDLDMAEEYGATVKRKQDLVLIPIVYAKPSDVVG